jgi:hypothetical protein
MPHLTIAQYARLKGITPQAVQGKIKRGKLKLVTVDLPAKRIFVDDMELEKIKP